MLVSKSLKMNLTHAKKINIKLKISACPSVQKIKVKFVLVGQTHDQIDQIFNGFAANLEKTRGFVLAIFVEAILDSAQNIYFRQYKRF